ncbi:hypothetical protein BDR22DRAFT_805996 [Usnea florida]
MEPLEDSDVEETASQTVEHTNDSADEDSADEDSADEDSADEDSDDEERAGSLEAFEVLELMMPMISGQKDEFGKELVPPLPLWFDRVSEWRKPVSTTKLLNIPVEVLALVVQKVPEISLASLALVNSDCRQLARSRQFASLHFDYSDRTLAIIDKLKEEATDRSNLGGLTSKPALGPCIRRLTVATHPRWINYRHNVELREVFSAPPDKERSRRLAAAYHALFGTYYPSIQDLLSNRTVLPHVELLDWEDKITLQPSFFDAIAQSTVQHLKIYRIHVDKLFAIHVPTSQPSRSWQLRSLYLDVLPAKSNRELDVSCLCTSILRACAPTLQSLTWESCRGGHITTDGLGSCPRFPSLRHLRLGFLRFADVCYLSELVNDGLNSLDVDTNSSSASSEFFDCRGRIPALKIFVWKAFTLPESQSLAFLRANPQISKLSIPWAQPATLLEDRILPLLAESFANLTSLGLVWAALSIPFEAIETITKITTLQQLHLSAGNQCDWRHDWLIDHGIMRRYLRHLPFLKKIAFSRDSYSNGFTETCERYYVDGLRSIEDFENGNHTRENFEEDHRQSILREADDYLEEKPQLEWLYFGQIPMDVEHSLDRGRRIARPLATERDSCWTLLQEMFGWKGHLPS